MKMPLPSKVPIVKVECLTLWLVLTFAFVGCSPRDPIDRLMAELPHQVFSHPFVPIELPEAATAEQLISALAKRGIEELGHFEFASFRIVEKRVTNVPQEVQGKPPVENYLAVLLDTNLGRRIVLFQPLRSKGEWRGWSYWIYDAK
jgi:hypothetical protein